MQNSTVERNNHIELPLPPCPSGAVCVPSRWFRGAALRRVECSLAECVGCSDSAVGIQRMTHFSKHPLGCSFIAASVYKQHYIPAVLTTWQGVIMEQRDLTKHEKQGRKMGQASTVERSPCFLICSSRSICSQSRVTLVHQLNQIPILFPTRRDRFSTSPFMTISRKAWVMKTNGQWR